MSDFTTHVTEASRRAEILRLLRESDGGLTAEQLARQLHLHPNTIRWHLGHLADAGLVASRARHRGRPGRPRIVYEPTSGAPDRRDGYRFLAEMLASSLHAAEDGETLAERAGHAWGGYLVEQPPPATALEPDAAAERIVELLDAHGFAATRVSDVVEMRRCPFHDLVDGYGTVICGLHRGLLQGALEALGSELVLETLETYPEPGVCRARLSRT